MVFRPPFPVAVRPAYAVLVAAAVGLMPRWSRQPLRLPSLPVSERTVVRLLGHAATGTIRWAMSPGRGVARDLQQTRCEGAGGRADLAASVATQTAQGPRPRDEVVTGAPKSLADDSNAD